MFLSTFKIFSFFLFFNSLSYGQRIVGDPVIENNPCPNLDLRCIRNYFARHSSCRPNAGVVPNTVYEEYSFIEFQLANTTVDAFGTRVLGLNYGRPTKFYVNPETGVTVLAVTFPNVTEYINRADIRYYRNSFEPLLTTVSSNTDFPEMILTTVFRGTNYISLDNSFTSGYLYNVVDTVLSPPAAAFDNTLLQPAFVDSFKYLNIYSRELIQQRARYFNLNYIQYAICNFGRLLL